MFCQEVIGEAMVHSNVIAATTVVFEQDADMQLTVTRGTRHDELMESRPAQLPRAMGWSNAVSQPHASLNDCHSPTPSIGIA